MKDLKNLSIVELSKEDQLNINGGDKFMYDVGHAIGSWWNGIMSQDYSDWEGYGGY